MMGSAMPPLLTYLLIWLLTKAYANVSVAAAASFNGILPLSRQPVDPMLSFMHSLEEFGTQKLLAVVAVEVSGTMFLRKHNPGNLSRFRQAATRLRKKQRPNASLT